MISRSWRISLSALAALALVGCAGNPPPPDIVTYEVAGHVPIDCGPEPAVDPVTMLPIERLEVVELPDGEQYVPIENAVRRYENLSLNLAAIAQSYQQRLVQVTWHRRCKAEFNARARASAPVQE